MDTIQDTKLYKLKFDTSVLRSQNEESAASGQKRLPVCWELIVADICQGHPGTVPLKPKTSKINETA